MKFVKILLLLAAWAGMIVTAWALGGSHLLAGTPGAPPQALRAPPDHATIVAAYSFAEIASFAANAAHQAPGGSQALGQNQASTPRIGESNAVAMQAISQRSAGAERDGGRGPAAPEPAGWVLLLSGLAVVACIARRRASRTLM
jgi:hypothetical protein